MTKTPMTNGDQTAVPCISIAVRAWNEEKAIRRTLESLFQQSLFEELNKRGEHCEVLCVPNGCTDRTAETASAVFAEQETLHPFAGAFTCRVDEVKDAGRTTPGTCSSIPFHIRVEIPLLDGLGHRFQPARNAVQYVCRAVERSLCLHLQRSPDQRHPFQTQKSWRDRISLATSEMTGTIQGQITGQLYCIRADVVRRIYLPKDLGAPDDGFIKAVVCTNFFSEGLDPKRIVLAENAAHVYEAYTSVAEVLNNQKRQMIGQTIVHVLIEYLKTLPSEQQSNLARTLRENGTVGSVLAAAVD